MNTITPYRPGLLFRWLMLCAGAVFLMVIIGAITRLTESGLSMVEWRPLIGAIPPLNDAEWQRVFDLYKQTPEFQKKNMWMQMEDFQRIFFWEWLHRLWGRMIGLIYGLPLIWFWLRGMVPPAYKKRLAFLFLLGGAQGVMGWYMVKSGLVDVPAVSHYRLAAHLGLAFLIYSLLIWTALSLRRDFGLGRTETSPAQLCKTLRWHAWGVLPFVLITITWGAFTAGLDAGLVYGDTFPQMGDLLIPPELWHLQPAWLNFLENPVGVQFLHRWLGIATGILILDFWLHGLIRRQAFAALHGLAAMVVVQILLGIATLQTGVHIHVAATHQAGALTLLTLFIIVLHRLQPVAVRSSAN